MIYDFWVQEPYKTFLINWQKTIEEWVKVYYKIYSKEMEKQFWVVWIFLKLLIN